MRMILLTLILTLMRLHVGALEVPEISSQETTQGGSLSRAFSFSTKTVSPTLITMIIF